MERRNCQCRECKRYFILCEFSQYKCIYCSSTIIIELSYVDEKGYIRLQKELTDDKK